MYNVLHTPTSYFREVHALSCLERQHRHQLADQGMTSSSSKIAAALRAAGKTLAVAETSAGGLISAALLAESGASAFFRGGVVCYTKASKHSLLSLEPGSTRPTATEPHAVELARAVRDRLGADYGVGESGVAGPAANSRGVMPGVCAIAVVGPGSSVRAIMLYPDDGLSAADAYGQAPKVPRSKAMESFSAAALSLASDVIESETNGERRRP